MKIILSIIFPPLFLYILVVMATSFANLEISNVDITEWSGGGRLIYFMISTLLCTVSLAISCGENYGGNE